MTIGERIKERRKELHLTPDEVAEKLGKNRATIYRYESDFIENLPITILEPLSKILKCTPAYLMGWEDEANVNTKLIGKRIRDIRHQRQMGQGELAKKINVALSVISMYESGTRSQIDIDKIEAIAKVLDVSPAYLVGWSDNADTENSDEKAIISKYSQLNKEGRKKTNEYIDDLLESPKYTNSSESEAAAENEILFEAARKKHSDVKIEYNNIDL